MIRDKFVTFKGSKLHYGKTGSGPKHLLIFHGFGQDLSVFDNLTRSLARHYTFYVFDLYFHGRSEWAHNEKTLTKTEWSETITLFLTENNINRFSIAGFSLGGKFVLTTVEYFPARIDEIFLIAPDGIKTNFWYSLATYPVLLRQFFKSMILHPERFMKIAEFLNRSGVVDKGLIRFADYQMNSEEKRKRVYYSWVVFRHLTPNLHKVVKAINENSIALTLIVGKYDNVIKAEKMSQFLRRVKKSRFKILESGHTGLINQSIPFFIKTDY
jgi:pimeloyl-ACP methyl ester carboxylesterase